MVLPDEWDPISLVRSLRERSGKRIEDIVMLKSGEAGLAEDLNSLLMR